MDVSAEVQMDAGQCSQGSQGRQDEVPTEASGETHKKRKVAKTEKQGKRKENTKNKRNTKKH